MGFFKVISEFLGSWTSIQVLKLYIFGIKSYIVAVGFHHCTVGWI